MSFGSIGKGTLPLIERYIAFVLTTFFIFFAPPAGQAGQPPAMTSYSGYFQGTSATKQAEPYAGIITYVTGYQNIKDQAEFQKSGLGYHFVIDKDGTIYQFRDPATTRSSHIQPKKYRTSQFDLTNRNALGVAFITGGKQPTEAQQAAAAQLIPFFQQKYNIPSGRVYHGEVQGADPDRNTLGPRDLVRTKEWFDVGVTPHEGPASRFDPFRRWDSFAIPAKLGRCVAECRLSGEPS